MKGRLIENPQAFFASLGRLHDSEIIKIAIDAETHSLKFFIEDINANFADLPGDPGRRTAILIFHDAADLFVDLSIDKGVRISAAWIESVDASWRLLVELNVGYGVAFAGVTKIGAVFKSLRVQYPEKP